MVDTPLKIAFMGTPDFAAVALQALIDSPHQIVCVYSQPPRPKGRGHKVQCSAVHLLAEQHAIPVYTPKTLKSAEAQAEFAAHQVDVAVVAAYGLLLPEAVLQAPKYGCLNIHGSLLPRWRGASPIQHAIWKGDAQSGVTIMQMDKGLDTGAMILKGEIALDAAMTASKLHDALAQMGARLTLSVLAQLATAGAVDAQKQDDDLSVYAPLLKKQDGHVDWAQSAAEIDRQVRALNPWPGVWADIQGQRFKILETRLVTDAQPTAQGGSVLNKKGHIACGQGSALHITVIQPEGKKAMDFGAALNGGYIKVDAVIE